MHSMSDNACSRELTSAVFAADDGVSITSTSVFDSVLDQINRRACESVGLSQHTVLVVVVSRTVLRPPVWI